MLSFIDSHREVSELF